MERHHEASHTEQTSILAKQATSNASEGLSEDDREGLSVRGRIVAIRNHRETSFIDIQLEQDKMQLVLRSSGAQELKRGDIIQANGRMGTTANGTPSLFVESTEPIVTAKTALPNPKEFVHQKNPPRHLELLMSAERREIIIARANLLQNIRTHLARASMYEVETPIINTHYNGGVSRPFVTRHNTLRREAFLRTSSEQYLKQMVIAGINGVYEIGKQFRNEGMSDIHNPEFTLLEAYKAYEDNTWMQGLLAELCRQPTDTDLKNDQAIDFDTPWLQSPLQTIVAETLQLDDDSPAHIAEQGRKKGLKGTNDQVIVRLFEKFVKKHLIQPIFVTGFPASLSPMTKLSDTDPSISLSYKGYAGGISLIDGSYEENDVTIQQQNFAAQAESHRIMGLQNYPRSTEFIEALQYGMPPLTGASLSIDRLVMLKTGSDTIRDVTSIQARR